MLFFQTFVELVLCRLRDIELGTSYTKSNGGVQIHKTPASRFLRLHLRQLSTPMEPPARIRHLLQCPHHGSSHSFFLAAVDSSKILIFEKMDKTKLESLAKFT
jgi:hypothetical protein